MPTTRRTTHVELLPCTIGGTDWGATVEDDHFLRDVDQSPLPKKAKKGTTGAPDEDGAEEPPEESRVVTEFAKITRKTPPRQSCYTRMKAWLAGRYENLISKDLMAEMYAKKCHELYTDGRTLCWLVCGTDCKTLCLTTCEQVCHKLCREVCRNVCTGQCRRCTGDCGQWEGCQGNCTKTCKGACIGVYEKISTQAPNEFLPPAPPLGYRLRNTKPDMSQIVYDEAEAEVRDPDPLIAAISLRMKWAEIQRLQRRSKELRARKIRDTYQLWDEAEDDGEEVMVPTSRESPSNLSHELGETRDLLEFAIRKYWKLRRYLSRESTVLVRFRLLISAIVQFASSITLFCLVASELEGGNFALVTTGFVAACVGVSVALLCIFGALPDIPNEALLFFCHCGEIWMSFIVVSFLLVDIEHMVTMQQECDPSLQNYGGDDPCSRLVRGYFTLAVAVVLAICVNVGTYTTAEELDKANNRATWADRFLQFKYRHALVRELQMPLLNHKLWRNDVHQIVAFDEPQLACKVPAGARAGGVGVDVHDHSPPFSPMTTTQATSKGVTPTGSEPFEPLRDGSSAEEQPEGQKVSI